MGIVLETPIARYARASEPVFSLSCQSSPLYNIQKPNATLRSDAIVRIPLTDAPEVPDWVAAPLEVEEAVLELPSPLALPLEPDEPPVGEEPGTCVEAETTEVTVESPVFCAEAEAVFML